MKIIYLLVAVMAFGCKEKVYVKYRNPAPEFETPLGPHVRLCVFVDSGIANVGITSMSSISDGNIDLWINGKHLVVTSGERPEADTCRYFLISYKTHELVAGEEHYGDFWFASKTFPSKNFIDSAVYSWLPKKKQCYQHIAITNIFEFKNNADYRNFGNNYEGNVKTPKPQKPCCKPHLTPMFTPGNYPTDGFFPTDTAETQDYKFRFNSDLFVPSNNQP